MEIKNIVGGIVVLIVGLILSVSVLVPVVADASESTIKETYLNDNADATILRMELADSEGELSWTFTDLNTISVTTGADVYTLPLTLDTDLMVTDHGFVRTSYSTSGGGTISIGVVDSNGTLQYVERSLATYSNGYTTTLSWSNGSYSLTTNGETLTYAGYSEMYVPSENGNYVMYNCSLVNAYVGDGDYIIGAGATETPYASYYTTKLYLESDIDSTTIIPYSNSDRLVTSVSNVVINAEELGTDGHTFSSVQFQLQIDGYGATNATYSRVIVPYEVTINMPMDSTIPSIISIIPLLVVTGLIIGAIGMFVSRRD